MFSEVELFMYNGLTLLETRKNINILTLTQCQKKYDLAVNWSSKQHCVEKTRVSRKKETKDKQK